MSFVSSPGALVRGSNPLTFLAPIAVTLAVVWYLSRMYLQQQADQV